MALSDILAVLQWWVTILILGTGFLPLSFIIFKNFFDRGYIFSKTLSIIFVSYFVFLLGIFHVLSFSTASIVFSFILICSTSLILTKKKINIVKILKANWRMFIFEELLFLSSIFFWGYIRSFNPDIHGLEKYMDYGFINSILRADYFPPKDMWFTPLPINYYYFGHLATAVLTKLSAVPSNITYNLMLSTVFALCATSAFSIGANLYSILQKNGRLSSLKLVVSGFLSAILVTLSGNLHIIYSFFKPYDTENPVPFWSLVFDPLGFPNSYWYPNATRFIHNTIHEFPIYSWVVADLHGHVLDIPFVLLTIAILLSLFISQSEKQHTNKESQISNAKFLPAGRQGQMPNALIGNLIFIGFLLAVMYMTNAWDGGIYFLLTGLTLLAIYYKKMKTLFLYIAIVLVSFLAFSYPYNYFFEPFASGIGILCAPEFLINIERLGPFIFEKNFCQHSPWWQLLTLYGFFYFFVFSFFVFVWRRKNLLKSDTFVLILITLSTFLILLPEFVYLKDIYPAHYRANTMFKLVFQAFIMLSISSGYIIVRIVSSIKYEVLSIKGKLLVISYLLSTIVFLSLVLTYPFLATNSYYNLYQTGQSVKNDLSLDGTAYLKDLYPEDYEAIIWINENIKGQPVILEAQSDSYTDFARVSSNTGLPTVLGWTVHEWLWRGSYDIPAPRIEEIKTIYETPDPERAKTLLEKYNVEYVFVGTLERQQYPALLEEKFDSFGIIIYEGSQTKIYKLTH